MCTTAHGCFASATLSLALQPRVVHRCVLSRMVPPAASSGRRISPSFTPLVHCRPAPQCPPSSSRHAPPAFTRHHAPSLVYRRTVVTRCRHPPSRHDLLPVTPSCTLWRATLRITTSRRCGIVASRPLRRHCPFIAAIRSRYRAVLPPHHALFGALWGRLRPTPPSLSLAVSRSPAHGFSRLCALSTAHARRLPPDRPILRPRAPSPACARCLSPARTVSGPHTPSPPAHAVSGPPAGPPVPSILCTPSPAGSCHPAPACTVSCPARIVSRPLGLCDARRPLAPSTLCARHLPPACTISHP
ncbi:hypothetical protein DENSPDRAFT_846298 [Dentipellis sp. KUC8613]|nr:hypothetical protein DENSPDRAFT_846298 [Dentipellis sp. KUC8613]